MSNILTRQKLLFLLVFVVFLLVVIQVTLSLSKSIRVTTTQTSLPTPTPILAPLPKDLTNITITTTPAQADNVSILATVSATFPRAIKENEKSNITLTISPIVEGAISWSSDNRTVSFTHIRAFITSQSYTTTLAYFNKRLVWSFTTASQDNLNQQEQNQLQLQADEDFGRWQQSVYDNFPWYDLLPIQSNSYFVFFDTASKKFIATLYVDQTSSQVEELKKDILSQFLTLGIPTNKYPFVWKYSPNSGSE